MGLTDSSKTIDVIIWLKIRNQAVLDKLAVDLYDRESSNHHQWMRPAEFARKFALAAQDAATVAGYFTSNGLSAVEIGPKKKYVRAGALDGCGYTPPEIQTAYNLAKLYNEGFDGTGQTIVIIDWCGSPTIRSDANAFSAAYDLPPLTQTNFEIINSSTPPTCGAPDPEINIDVEEAHAIAPGAAIDLAVPPSASFADVDTAEFFAVINNLGSVISGSYGSEEYYDAPAELQMGNQCHAHTAAARHLLAGGPVHRRGDCHYNTFSIPIASI